MYGIFVVGGGFTVYIASMIHGVLGHVSPIEQPRKDHELRLESHSLSFNEALNGSDEDKQFLCVL